MNALHNEPKVRTHGRGHFGVRFTRFVLSGAPGGYSAVELAYLFTTAEERDAFARKLRRERKGSRRTGPIIETFDVEAAELSWFEPAYHRLVLLDTQAEHPYGMVRIYDCKPPVYDVRYAQDEDELRWMLAAQWKDALPEGGPRVMYDVYFFTPDEPIRLRMVVELDDSEEEAEADA